MHTAKAEPHPYTHHPRMLAARKGAEESQRKPAGTPMRQRGFALLAILAVLGAGAIYLFVTQLNAAQLDMKRMLATEAALAQAAEAVMSYASSQRDLDDTGYLTVPDTGWTGTPEGNSEGTMGIQDMTVIGKVPWITLGIATPRDSQGECLWYVVSGRFKGNPRTDDPFNWDTPGQIDVIDGSGNVLHSNLPALIASPGYVLDSQDRSLANTALTQCGGNYNARNYLDSFNDTDAVSGQVNYFPDFPGSTNHAIAPDISSKQFVLAANGHYNDRLRAITVDDIYRAIIRRSDFAAEVKDLLDDLVPHVRTIAVSNDAKGTTNIDCTGVSNEDFCDNWREMLLLTELSPPAHIKINGVNTSTTCKLALIFGGQRTPSQVRVSSAEKASKDNYIEAPNLAAFAIPIASTSDFEGNSDFDYKIPSSDLIRCVGP